VKFIQEYGIGGDIIRDDNNILKRKLAIATLIQKGLATAFVKQNRKSMANYK